MQRKCLLLVPGGLNRALSVTGLQSPYYTEPSRHEIHHTCEMKRTRRGYGSFQERFILHNTVFFFLARNSILKSQQVYSLF